MIASFNNATLFKHHDFIGILNRTQPVGDDDGRLERFFLAGVNVAVLVCSPSPADLWTTKHTAEAIGSHIPKGARLRLLFNGVLSNSVLARELPALADRIGVKPLSAVISRRQVYQHAALIGWPALDREAREELFNAALEIVLSK